MTDLVIYQYHLFRMQLRERKCGSGTKGFIYHLSSISCHLARTGPAAIVLALLATAGCTARVEYERPRAESSPSAVNINTAGVPELEQLPYVGRRTAEAIVEYREQNGRFRRPEHILLVRGISSKRFDEIRPLITAR